MASSVRLSCSAISPRRHRGVGRGMHLVCGRQILHRVVVLVQVPLHAPAQHVQLGREFLAPRLPVVQRHLLRPRFRVRLGHALDQPRVVIDAVRLAGVVRHFFQDHRRQVHRLAVLGLDGDHFFGVLERPFRVVRLHVRLRQRAVNRRAPRRIRILHQKRFQIFHQRRVVAARLLHGKLQFGVRIGRARLRRVRRRRGIGISPEGCAAGAFFSDLARRFRARFGALRVCCAPAASRSPSVNRIANTTDCHRIIPDCSSISRKLQKIYRARRNFRGTNLICVL